MEWLNFRHLYSFWMVHKEGSFYKAAQAMYVSQSTVSEQVKLLEDYFQKELFERLPKNLKLTDAGKELLVYADDIFSKSREINQVVRDDEYSNKQINLSVGITGSISRNLLFRFFNKMLKNESVGNLHITGGGYEELVRACKNYELDFFITDEPPRGKDVSGLQTKVLFKSPMILAGKKKNINKVKRDRFNEIELYHFKHPFIDESLLPKVEEKYNVRFANKIMTDDISLLRFFANSENGVSIIPEIGVYEDLLKNQVEKIQLMEYKWIDFYVSYSKKAVRNKIIGELLSDKNIHSISKSVLEI
jgi:LysR family transcriptional activator of nhaA